MMNHNEEIRDQICAQWVDFIGIHEERHLAQLKEALDGI